VRRGIPRVLSIAGSDPSGGAGIQADLKSIAALGGYGMAAITALTAQNTRGVRALHVPPASFLAQQLEAISDDITIDAVKIGMLGDAEVIAVVRGWLENVRPADSIALLASAVERITALGYRVSNVDVTVIAQQPKLLPHLDAMRDNLAAALQVGRQAVSVKGKTNEGVDGMGRGEAMACHAVALLATA